MTELNRRKELGAFLRSRREALSPGDEQRRERSRRRTAGLRREEVADLAGVGVSWYTWLEQGRDISPSSETLQRIAAALRLTNDESRYVLELAGKSLPQSGPSLTETVTPALQRVLDTMELIPAFIMNRRWDRVAWNDAVLALMGDFSGDAPRERNTVWRTFTNPVPRGYTENWEAAARTLVAEFHAGTGRYIDEPWMVEFVAELNTRSAQFREWWPLREVLGHREKRTRIKHPLGETIAVEHSYFQILPECGLTLCMFNAEPDGASPLRLRRIIKAFKTRRDEWQGLFAAPKS